MSAWLALAKSFSETGGEGREAGVAAGAKRTPALVWGTGGRGTKTGVRKTGTALAPAGPQEEGVEVSSNPGVVLAEEYGSFQFESSESATGPEPLKKKRKNQEDPVPRRSWETP